MIDNNSNHMYQSLTEYSQQNETIIPNNKVNRQLFESEVQLLNALHDIRVKDKSCKKELNCKQVLIYDLKFMTNDPVISNSRTCDDEHGVSYLPDNITTIVTSSDLITEIVKSRKLKFHKTFSTFQYLTGNINKKTEESISQLCQMLKNNLSESKDRLNECEIIKSRTVTTNIIRKDFDNLYLQLKNTFQHQSLLLKTFYDNILQLESERILSIFKLLTQSAAELVRIGHMAPSEVHRIINLIIIEINLSIIKNKMVYNDLKTKLNMSIINDERKIQIHVNNQQILWQKITIDTYLEEVKLKIETESNKIFDAIAENKPLEDLIAKLAQKNEDIFTEIGNKMIPGEADVSLINCWINELKEICAEYGVNCELFINTSSGNFEDAIQILLGEIKSIKKTVLDQKIFDEEHEYSSLVDSICLPMLNDMHLRFEKTLQKIEVHVEDKQRQLEKDIEKLDVLLRSLWNLWMNHEMELKKREESLFSNLNARSISNQDQCLTSENELNEIIDKMRQGSTEQVLKEDLKKSTNLLNKIKSNYTHFHEQQINLTKQYPSVAGASVKIFEDHVKNFFSNCVATVSDNNDVDSCTLERNEEKNDENDSDNSSIVKLSLEISSIQFDDLTKKLENMFTNFIENWYKTVEANATMVVTVKNEELTSELKLRCHLHEPRYKRIEFDVYNVRLTELLIHSERVSKHCKGIENSLNNIFEEYALLDDQNSTKQEQFKDKLSLLEQKFSSSTNVSKLLSINKILEERNKEYMEDIRNIIRTFQKTIETKLQTLRMSNANFICSFKLFSVGGNFCIDEIDNFTKTVEKLNKKIDEVEGEIMSNLENIEKRQQDVLLQCKSSFEDKFKYHVVDINFIDKINRAFHNIQLKIKSEVENSNSQSRIIYENINSLKKDFIDKLKLEKTPTSMHSSILSFLYTCFAGIHDRCTYLDCLEVQKNPKIKSYNLEEGSELINSKVQFSAITALSKGGKQANEDCGIRTVKHLLQSQSIHLLNERVGNEAGVNSSNLDHVPENLFKGKEKICLADNKNQRANNSRSASVKSESVSSEPKHSVEKSKLVNKNQRLDKKYLVFEDEFAEDKVSFLNNIRLFCKDILDGILYAAELFYRNKGMRKVTNSSLPDNFDQAMEDIIRKLKFYFQQATEYHSKCLKEFNAQLTELESVINRLPDIMFSNILDSIVSECVQSLEEYSLSHLNEMKMFSDQRTQIYSNLKSNLEQPSKENDLQNLLSQETLRQNQEKSSILKSLEENNKIIFSCGRKFFQVLSDFTERFLMLMDNILTTKDILSPEAEKSCIVTADIIRGQDKESRTSNNRDIKYNNLFNKTTWFTNDMNDILSVDDANKKLLEESSSKCVISAKCTSCHEGIMDARIKVIEKFRKFYFEKLNETKNLRKQRLIEMDNYNSFWNDSVQNLRCFQVNCR